jgi:hypothetical protein
MKILKLRQVIFKLITTPKTSKEVHISKAC